MEAVFNIVIMLAGATFIGMLFVAIGHKNNKNYPSSHSNNKGQGNNKEKVSDLSCQEILDKECKEERERLQQLSLEELGKITWPSKASLFVTNYNYHFNDELYKKWLSARCKYLVNNAVEMIKQQEVNTLNEVIEPVITVEYFTGTSFINVTYDSPCVEEIPYDGVLEAKSVKKHLRINRNFIEEINSHSYQVTDVSHPFVTYDPQKSSHKSRDDTGIFLTQYYSKHTKAFETEAFQLTTKLPYSKVYLEDVALYVKPKAALIEIYMASGKKHTILCFDHQLKKLEDAIKQAWLFGKVGKGIVK